MLQGVAEAELEKDLERTFKILFYSAAEAVRKHTHAHTHHQVCTGRKITFKSHNKSTFLCFLSSIFLSAVQESVLEVRLKSAEYIIYKSSYIH